MCARSAALANWPIACCAPGGKDASLAQLPARMLIATSAVIRRFTGISVFLVTLPRFGSAGVRVMDGLFLDARREGQMEGQIMCVDGAVPDPGAVRSPGTPKCRVGNSEDHQRRFL